MNNSYLMHYGVKGMRWGVRNGPPYPLKGVAKDRVRREAASKTKDDVDDIVKSLSYDEKLKLGLDEDDLKYSNYLNTDQGEYVIHRVLKKIGKIPVSFFDMLDDGDTINLALQQEAAMSIEEKVTPRKPPNKL